MNRTKKTLLSVFMLFLTTGASAFPFISPYAYCNNNPVNRIDPDGRDDYYTSDGLFLFRDDKETDRIIIRNTEIENIKRIKALINNILKYIKREKIQ